MNVGISCLIDFMDVSCVLVNTLFSEFYEHERHETVRLDLSKGTSRQRSGKGAIRKRFPLQKPRWEKTKLTIRYIS